MNTKQYKQNRLRKRIKRMTRSPFFKAEQARLFKVVAVLESSVSKLKQDLAKLELEKQARA